MTPDIVLQRLSGLREQRAQAHLTEQELRERTKIAVRDAQAQGIPMAEIARRLGMDRSTLYRVYTEAA